MALTGSCWAGVDGDDGWVSDPKLLGAALGEWLEMVGIALPSMTRTVLTDSGSSLLISVCDVLRFSSPGSSLGIGWPTGGSLGLIWAGEVVVSIGDGWNSQTNVLIYIYVY